MMINLQYSIQYHHVKFIIRFRNFYFALYKINNALSLLKVEKSSKLRDQAHTAKIDEAPIKMLVLPSVEYENLKGARYC